MPIPQKLDTWLPWNSRHREPASTGAACRGAAPVEGSVMGTGPPGSVPPVLGGANTPLTGKSGHTYGKGIFCQKVVTASVVLPRQWYFSFFPPFVPPLKLQEQVCLPGHSFWVAPFRGSVSWPGRAVLRWASGLCVTYTRLGDTSRWISVARSVRGSGSFSGGRLLVVNPGNLGWCFVF